MDRKLRREAGGVGVITNGYRETVGANLHGRN
jgi:hypothetical protein